MKISFYISVFIITIALVLITAHAQSNRILEKDIQKLELDYNREANCQRVCPAGPQIQCEPNWGSTCNYKIKHVDCENAGANANGRVNWKCYAHGLNEHTEITRAEVSCEGYSYEGDEYILLGSCIYKYGMKYKKRGATLWPLYLFIAIISPYLLCCLCAICCFCIFLTPLRSRFTRYKEGTYGGDDGPYHPSASLIAGSSR